MRSVLLDGAFVAHIGAASLRKRGVNGSRIPRAKVLSQDVHYNAEEPM